MYAMTNQRPKDERGQVLLLAVIIMLLIALVAAVFITTVAHDITASDRESDSVQSRNLAEAGIRYVSEQLNRYGADWRPGPGGAPGDPTYWDEVEISRGWDRQGYVKYPHPDGVNSPTPQDPAYNQVDHFLVRVDYAPTPGDMLSKCLRISAVGRPGNNLYIFHRRYAFKPIGLTDYAWFVTDRTRQPGAAVLGLPWIDLNGDGVQQAAEALGFLVDGPVRSNKDLVWDAPVAVNLAAGEQVLVAGQITHAVNGVPDSAVTINVNGTAVGPSGSAAFPTGNPQYRDNYPASGDPLRAVRRLTPPSLGLDEPDPATGRTRYEELTKYSGEDIVVTNNASGVNTGQYPYYHAVNGVVINGLYIDNFTDTQDPVDVRNEWLQPHNWGGRTYLPLAEDGHVAGAEVVLYPNDPTGTTATPKIYVQRSDHNWPTLSGTLPNMVESDSGDPEAYFDYPANGVIYAEGNLRLHGVLPVSSAGADYNLTVVSGGIIYVDGNLLRPTDAGFLATDGPQNTRIALLARDHIVINPTQFFPQTVAGVAGGSWNVADLTDPHWILDPTGTQAEFLIFNLGQPPTGRLYLTVKHADQDAADGLPCSAEISLWDWGLGRWSTSAVVPGVTATGQPITVPYPSYTTPLMGGVYYQPDAWSVASSIFQYPGSAGFATAGLDNYVRLQSAAGSTASQSSLHLTNAKIEQLDGSGHPIDAGLTLVVSALLYAERGSLFIIPGDWFDPTMTSELVAGGTGNAGDTPADRYARFRRYNYRVVVNGAVVINDTPSLADVGEWNDKWSYPVWNGGGYDWYPVEYHYDGGLATERAPNLPRLPHLPVSEDVLFTGQEE